MNEVENKAVNEVENKEVNEVSNKEIDEEVNGVNNKVGKEDITEISGNKEIFVGEKLLSEDKEKVYTGSKIDKIYQSNWEYGKENIPVYNIEGSKDPYENYLSSEEKIITFVTDKGDFHQFSLLGDVGYYGYRIELDADRTASYASYIYSIEKDLIAENVPNDLNAVYSKKDGFVYGPLDHRSDQINTVVSTADITMNYTNGIVKGIITENNSRIANNELFKIDGDTKSLVITPTQHVSNGIIPNDRAVMDIQFVNSAENRDDHKYILGTTKTESWIAVLAAEKQN
ncbi:PlpE family protein [Proteus hauseri ATCC 700826]|uniref:PlpE family protein n=1 Tax=Proteus hauseri ATCC 700826 TaxID=1354271 RepID=A0AAJ3HRN2_PROHU|nr:PlpE family protein [Proteus hauseri ATCC 700826]